MSQWIVDLRHDRWSDKAHRTGLTSLENPCGGTSSDSDKPNDRYCSYHFWSTENINIFC